MEKHRQCQARISVWIIIGVVVICLGLSSVLLDNTFFQEQQGEEVTLRVISKAPNFQEVPVGTPGAITTTLAEATATAKG